MVSCFHWRTKRRSLRHLFLPAISVFCACRPPVQAPAPAGARHSPRGSGRAEARMPAPRRARRPLTRREWRSLRAGLCSRCKFDHASIEAALVGHVKANERGRDLVADVPRSFQHAFSAEACGRRLPTRGDCSCGTEGNPRHRDREHNLDETGKVTPSIQKLLGREGIQAVAIERGKRPAPMSNWK